MNQKAARREAAIKKAKLKKKLLITVGALAAVVVVGLMIYGALQNHDRVFTAAGNQVITLYEDGNFTARLPHGVFKEGMYFEQIEEGGFTTVFFILEGGGILEAGMIEGNVLTPPLGWDDGHGHDRAFILN